MNINLKNVKVKYTGGEVGWIGDVPKFSYNTTKLKNLGWSANLSSDAAIEESIKNEILFRELLINWWKP